MSALLPKADIGTQSRNVCFVPTADIVTFGNDQLVLLMERGMPAETTPRVVGLHHAQAFVNRYLK